MLFIDVFLVKRSTGFLNMSELSPLELEVANLIIDSLALEDVAATDIVPEGG